VRIQDYEGTVTELGLFVTRLRTGMGEEIALPNAFVLGNVTRNFSRIDGERGYVLDCKLTIGYDTPWRQVHALLLEAAQRVPAVLDTPAPFVVQTALSDFYVEYKLVVYADSKQPMSRAHIASRLNAEIQDEFNRNEVQIMSPHYLGDPASAKWVPESRWRVDAVKDGDA
jgi:small-conductance mechanosensitive channel